MRTVKVAFGLGAVFILGGVLFFRTPSVILTTSKKVTKQLPIFTSQKNEEITLPPPVIRLEPQTQNEVSTIELKPFENKKELNDYSLLRKKIFLTDKEKLQKQNFLKNEPFITRLKDLFKAPSIYSNSEDQQNAAVDFLLDALNSENSTAAAEVLRSIIQDPSTENENLSMADRETLAGVKAEVLYKWTAQEPLKASEIQQWLPGPVSQKIWKNVLAQQEMNQAESELSK